MPTVAIPAVWVSWEWHQTQKYCEREWLAPWMSTPRSLRVSLVNVSHRSWVLAMSSPHGKTKTNPRVLMISSQDPRCQDRLRKQGWLHHLSGSVSSSLGVSGTLLIDTSPAYWGKNERRDVWRNKACVVFPTDACGSCVFLHVSYCR